MSVTRSITSTLALKSAALIGFGPSVSSSSSWTTDVSSDSLTGPKLSLRRTNWNTSIAPLSLQAAAARYIIVICGHNRISVLWGNTTYRVKLSCEDLSRYWNKIVSVDLRNCPYYHTLLRESRHNNKHFGPHIMVEKQLAGINMVWRNYVTVTLCIRH